MSQITMGNTWQLLMEYKWVKLWVIHMSQITMGNTYESNYYG